MSEVEISLGGRAETLRCSLDAAKRINAYGGGGGFAAVQSRLIGSDLDTVTFVVAAGLGKKPADVEVAVYENGLAPLIAPLLKFTDRLINGGREPSGEKREGEA